MARNVPRRPPGLTTYSGSYTNPHQSPEHAELHRMMQEDVYERYRSLREAFLNFDKDRSGKISPEEVSVMLVVFGLDELNLPKVFARCDRDGDGRLSFKEFCAALRKTAMPFVTEVERLHEIGSLSARGNASPNQGASKEDMIYNKWKQFNSAVLTFDKGGTGYIHKDAMRVLLKMFGLESASARYVLARCDHHGQSRISYVEFSKALKKAEYALVSTPELRSPPGAQTRRHSEAMATMSARHEKSSKTTREQRIAEALVKAAPDSPLSPPSTGRSHASTYSRRSRLSTDPLSPKPSPSPGRSSRRFEPPLASPGAARSHRSGQSPLSPSRVSHRSGHSGYHGHAVPTGSTTAEHVMAHELFEKFRSLSKAFARADQDRSGFLEAREVWRLCTRFDMSGNMVADVIKSMDKNKDGMISWEEFTQALSSATRCPGLYAAVPRVQLKDRRPKPPPGPRNELEEPAAMEPAQEEVAMEAAEAGDIVPELASRKLHPKDFERSTPAANSTRSCPA